MKDLFKINLNQNLWALVISLAALGLGEYFNLNKLENFGILLTITTIVSYVITLVAYTINYWNNKMKKTNEDRKSLNK